MSFLFASSHLPQSRVRRAQAKEEEEKLRMQAPERSGMVRAFSHLPDPVRPQAEPDEPPSTSPGMQAGRPPAPTSTNLPSWLTTPEADTDHEEDRDEDHEEPRPSSRAPERLYVPPATHAPEETRPWYPSQASAKDQPPSGYDEDEPDPYLGADRHARSPGVDDTPPASPRNPSSRSAPQGRLFERRLPPQRYGDQALDRAGSSNLVHRPQGGAPEQPRSASGAPGALFAAVKTPPQKQVNRQAPPALQARPANTTPRAPQKPAQGGGPKPPAQKPAAAPQAQAAPATPQGGGSLGRYRDMKNDLLEQLKNLQEQKRPTKDTIKQIEQVKMQLAVVTRNMESIELAAQLVNHMKKDGEDAIDPEKIDENSAEFKERVKDAIKRLHGDTAPWMDNLADNFGEREGPKGKPNPKLVEALSDPKSKSKVDPTDESWCGYALGKAMADAGIKPPATASRASEWRGWGKDDGPKAGGPHVGDVYHIKYNNGKGHVTTVIGVSADGTQVFCLGGNQNDGLNIAAYPIGAFNDPKHPGTGTYKDATIVFITPPGQNNNIPAPTFDYHADPSAFDYLAPVTR